MRTAVVAIAGCLVMTAQAQEPELDVRAKNSNLETSLIGRDHRQPTCRRMMDAISAERVRAIDDKLVSFGTRHTLSDTTSETRGIGAARKWIKGELESYNKGGGKLEVAFEE